MRYSINDVKLVRSRTGLNNQFVTDALSKCDSVQMAICYLELKSMAVCHYKTDASGHKIPWDDADYIDYARKLTSSI